jgi:hypothetical protein
MTLLRRLLVASGIALGIVAVPLVPAAPVLAHNGTGGATSDYRVEITGYEGDPTGIDLRVVELGNRVELRRTSASSVIVLGYVGEPYLRLDGSGVAENTSSPAHYLNRDRFASTSPPENLTATTPPTWEQLSTGRSVRWHDHRVHWMSTVPPEAVQQNPDSEQLVREDRVDLIVDGRDVSADIRITWLPKPDRMGWLVVASVLVLAVGAVFVLGRPPTIVLAVFAIDAAIAATLAQGTSVVPIVIGGVIALIGVVAFVLRRPTISIVAAAGGGALAATRLEVFEHELLAGLPAVAQRVLVVVALGLGLGVAAAGLVQALSATPSSEDSPEEAS